MAPVERVPGGLQLGEPRPLLQQEGQQYAPAISPDGRWVAYQSDESGRAEIYVMAFSPLQSARSGKWQVSNAGGSWPEWARNGREIFFRSADRFVMAAGYATRGDSFVVEKPRVWAGRQLANVGEFSSFDVASDGKRVAGLFDAEEAGRQTHLRLILNVNDSPRKPPSRGSTN